MKFFKTQVLENIKSGSENLRIFGDIDDSAAEEVAKALKEARVDASENAKPLTLTELSFEHAKISNNGLKLIMQELVLFPKLRSIEFDFCYIQSEGAKSIADLLLSSKSMTRFTFMRNCATEACWSEYTQYARVSENECNSWIEIFAPAIAANQYLTYVDLSCSTIDDNAAQLLAAALSSNKCLEKLDIGYSKISPDNMKKVCLAIKDNKSLKNIRAQFCGDPRPYFGGAGEEIYQFHRIASQTIEDKEKCMVFDEFDYFASITSRKRKRHSLG